MGTFHHHAIVITADHTYIEAARTRAQRVFAWVSPVSPQAHNGYQSFFIPPDGSKEGWEPSYDGDKRRFTFINWLNSQAYSDGSNKFNWVEVGYGDFGYQVERSDDDLWRERDAQSYRGDET